jgi:hypothetical protein
MMTHKLTRLVHENLSIVMCFAYSQKPLADLIEASFGGEHKYLNKALFEISEERANKACLELAIFLRMLDDEQKSSAYDARTKNVTDCGRLIKKDDTVEALTFREVTNKVIHSSRLEWKLLEFSNPEPGSRPSLICHTGDEEKWVRAEVDLAALAFVCGRFMS